MTDDKKKKDKDSGVHESLKGFDLHVNRFGQIESTFDIDKVNEFLNENIDDKKLRDKSDSEEE